MTKEARVPFFFADGIWGYHLPNAAFIADSIQPILPNLNHANGVYGNVDPTSPQLRALTCLVDVDVEDWDDDNGRLNEKGIAAKYTPNIVEKVTGVHRAEHARRNRN